MHTVSAGPYASRGASAFGIIGRMVEYVGAIAPLSEHLSAEEVGLATAFLCSPLASGITVTLTATPATGSSFAGWSGGGCTGTGTCKLTLTSTMIVTAAFNESSP